MDSLYSNLLRATDNTADITNEKYAIITKVKEKGYDVRELDSNLEHFNVANLNNLSLKVGDKVVLGFVENSIYNPVVLGVLNPNDLPFEIGTDDVVESSALINIGTSANATQHDINLKIDEKINQGGSGGIVMVGSFEIDSNGHLIATLPTGASNPYSIDSSGHLVYDTTV